MSAMYAEHIDPEVTFETLDAEDGDVFAWDNPIWSRAGVVAPAGSDSGTLTTRVRRRGTDPVTALEYAVTV